MSSNSSYIADLNLLAPLTSPPQLSSDDLTADLEFWRNAQFTVEMPPPLENPDEEAATTGDVVDLEDGGAAESSAAAAATTTTTATPAPAPTFGGLDLMGLSNMSPAAAATAAAALAMSPLFAFNQMATQTLQQQLLIPSVGSAGPAAPTNTSGYPAIYPAPPVSVPSVAGANDAVNVSAAGSIQTKPLARKSSTPSRRSTLRPANTEVKPSSDPVRLPNAAATMDSDLVAKLASEEDKRRRNTAASARFRIKKKMKEQALEHTAREMTEKVQQLQERVKELELENKWLRELVVEKDPVLLELGRSSKRKRAAVSIQDEEEEEEEEEDDYEERDEIEERDKRKGKKAISATKEVDKNRSYHMKKQEQKRQRKTKKDVQEAKGDDEIVKPVLIKVEQLDIDDEKPL